MAVLSETIAIPIWAAVMAAVAIAALTIVIHQLATVRQAAAVIGIAALLVAFSVAAPPVRHPGALGSLWHESGWHESGGDAERRALEARRAELTARATMPGSSLSCLNALASEPVESACRQAVFASPTSAAVAVSYAAAQLRLLADGLAYARRSDAAYAINLADLRLAVENDAYGVYAHVLATRDRCTAEKCAAFALLHDSSTLKVHLRQRLYSRALGEHRDRWGETTTPTQAAIAPLAVALPSAAPVAPAPIESIVAAAMATMATPAAPVSAAATPTPLPKARPAMTVAARAEPLAVNAEASADTPDILPAETEGSGAVSARAEQPVAAVEVPRPTAGKRRGVVPPAASVLPNLDFPSASSIPAINIMAAEPKLPPADIAPAASSTAPRSPARAQ